MTTLSDDLPSLYDMTGKITDHNTLLINRNTLRKLEVEAVMYQFLRRHVVFGYPSSEGSSSKDVYLVVTGYGDYESDVLTDKAIDVKMKGQSCKQ